jgi:hypothetical protein
MPEKYLVLQWPAALYQTPGPPLLLLNSYETVSARQKNGACGDRLCNQLQLLSGQKYALIPLLRAVMHPHLEMFAACLCQ